MDVTSFYTNIPQEKEIQTVCVAYDTFYKDTRLLAQALRLILRENSFQFCGKNYLQTHGTPMDIKWRSHLPIRYLRAKSKQKSLAKVHSNLSLATTYRRHFLPLGHQQGGFNSIHCSSK